MDAPKMKVDMTGEQAVNFLLHSAQVTQRSWLMHPEQQRLLHDYLVSSAHQIACNCENSTLDHLQDWMHKWLDTHDLSDVPEASGDG